MPHSNPLKLVFYSGGQEPSNHLLHEGLSSLVSHNSKKSLTYIPYLWDGHRTFYERSVRRYRKFGFTKFHCLPVDRPFLKEDAKKALQSDVIYLAGGNTFYFLKCLRESGFLGLLKKYAQKGGVIAGLSAGGLVMTPHIGLAGYPRHLADPNEVRLKNLKALSLVQFEFFPHYSRSSKRLDDALSRYSKRSRYPIVASPDGGGVILNGSTTAFYGRTSIFQKGRKFTLWNHQ